MLGVVVFPSIHDRVGNQGNQGDRWVKMRNTMSLTTIAYICLKENRNSYHFFDIFQHFIHCTYLHYCANVHTVYAIIVPMFIHFSAGVGFGQRLILRLGRPPPQGLAGEPQANNNDDNNNNKCIYIYIYIYIYMFG